MSRQSQRQSPADLAIAPSLKLQNDWKCLHLIQHQVDEGCTRTYLEQGEDTNRPGCVTEGAYSIRMRGVDSLELLTLLLARLCINQSQTTPAHPKGTPRHSRM